MWHVHDVVFRECRNPANHDWADTVISNRWPSAASCTQGPGMFSDAGFYMVQQLNITILGGEILIDSSAQIGTLHSKRN